jgi:cell wall-associated NlpC family hydrolase
MDDGMTEIQLREHIVATARSWISTPFHDGAALKGVGVDCANLLNCVLSEAGAIEPLEIEPYSPQWFLHRSEEKFMGYVLRRGREIAESEALAGDIVLYKIGRCYAHGAFIVKWSSEIVHAYKSAGSVIRSGGRDGELYNTPAKFFSVIKSH